MFVSLRCTQLPLVRKPLSVACQDLGPVTGPARETAIFCSSE